MSNSARFIILGSEHGLGLSVSTCRMQIDHGLTNPLYLPCLQPWPAPTELAVVFSTFPSTDLSFLVKADCREPGLPATSFALQCVVGLGCYLSCRRLHWSGFKAALHLINAFGEFPSRMKQALLE